MGKNKNINQGHYLELMDRIYIIQDGIDVNITRHPAMTKKQAKKLSKVQELLGEVYQWAGKKDFEWVG